LIHVRFANRVTPITRTLTYVWVTVCVTAYAANGHPTIIIRIKNV